EQRAKPLAASWEGDRYQLYENQQSKRLLLVARIHFSSQVHAARFFGQYSELLEKKHQQRTNLFRRPDFFSFDTPEGGVFLRCSATDCLVVEGGERSVFVELNKQLDLGPVPEPDQKLDASPTKTVSNVEPVVEATVRWNQRAYSPATLARWRRNRGAVSRFASPPRRASSRATR